MNTSAFPKTIDVNRRLAATALALVFWAAARSTASADDAAALTSRIGGSAAGLTSFVVQYHYAGTTGLSSTATFVRPARAKISTVVGQFTTDIYLVDGMLYMRRPDGVWQKAHQNASAANLGVLDTGTWLSSSKVQPLPDRNEDGVTVGSFALTTQAAAGARSVEPTGSHTYECTYDKSTYLLRMCSNQALTMTFSKYNDPSNTVVLPPEAQTATPLMLPAPATVAPAASSPAGPAVASPAPAAPAASTTPTP